MIKIEQSRLQPIRDTIYLRIRKVILNQGSFRGNRFRTCLKTSFGCGFDQLSSVRCQRLPAESSNYAAAVFHYPVKNRGSGEAWFGLRWVDFASKFHQKRVFKHTGQNVNNNA